VLIEEDNLMLRKRLFASVLVVLCSLTAAIAQEVKLRKPDLPVAVQKTVDQQSEGATVRGFSRETENGQTIYEAELTTHGHSKDISMDTNGNVLEIEEEVPFDSLPDGVKQGLTAKAGRGKIGKVESLTKRGKLVAYEAMVMTGTGKSEIQVGPDGKPLAHEE
jgi:hypothetical protein